MSQATELIKMLKYLDGESIKYKWTREKLETMKEKAIWDYYHMEQSIHDKNHHHIRRDLDNP